MKESYSLDFIDIIVLSFILIMISVYSVEHYYFLVLKSFYIVHICICADCCLWVLYTFYIRFILNFFFLLLISTSKNYKVYVVELNIPEYQYRNCKYFFYNCLHSSLSVPPLKQCEDSHCLTSSYVLIVLMSVKLVILNVLT